MRMSDAAMTLRKKKGVIQLLCTIQCIVFSSYLRILARERENTVDMIPQLLLRQSAHGNQSAFQFYET